MEGILLKKFRNILIIVVLVLLIGGFIFYKVKTSQTVELDSNVLGNTSGNIYNNGLFAENDGRIYFSNLSDNGALYSMKNDLSDYSKISSDKIVYINVTDPYIVYSRINNKKEQTSKKVIAFHNVGIYRINKDGSNTVSLDTTAAGMVNQEGNYVYFQHYDKASAYSLYSVKLDGKESKMLEDDPIYPGMIKQNTLYYAGYLKDHKLYKKDLVTNANSEISEGNYYMPILTDRYLYYIDAGDNYKIKRAKTDGSDPETLVDKRCSTYNLSQNEKYLYCQVDNQTDNGIYSVDTTSNTLTPIMSGNYCNINVTSHYVFFQGFNQNQYYKLTIGNGQTADMFNPEVED
ncbi:hypothetical protein lbkm_0253 [Lachnospiraceae bacterium KM106-2]|nr:hypothetical protein lbkm_0253 [Lachnospiraceae bacterium KM106-2]